MEDDLPLACVTSADRSEGIARREVLRAVPGARIERRLAPGVLIAEVPGGFGALARAFAASPPVFVRHIAPLARRAPAGDDPLGALLRLAPSIAEGLDPAGTFSVQARAFPSRPGLVAALRRDLAEALVARGLPLDARSPDRIVSVVVAADDVFAGVSRTAENLSDWAGGEIRFAREEGTVSRSEFKLLEALRTFRIDPPRGGRALDLGAAPGGWTRILAGRGLRVDAVDPAALHPSVARLAGVRHHRTTAGRFLSSPGPGYDLLVCDVRADAGRTAEILLAAAGRLAPGAVGVATFKLPRRGGASLLDRAVHRLQGIYERIGLRQLRHDRNEVTGAFRRTEVSGR